MKVLESRHIKPLGSNRYQTQGSVVEAFKTVYDSLDTVHKLLSDSLEMIERYDGDRSNWSDIAEKLEEAYSIMKGYKKSESVGDNFLPKTTDEIAIPSDESSEELSDIEEKASRLQAEIGQVINSLDKDFKPVSESWKTRR